MPGFLFFAGLQPFVTHFAQYHKISKKLFEGNDIYETQKVRLQEQYCCCTFCCRFGLPVFPFGKADADNSCININMRGYLAVEMLT